MIKRLNYILVAIVLLTLCVNAAAQSSFKIVVNTANPVTSISKADLQRIFLKKTTKWEDNTQITPVDLKSTSSIRASFSNDILNKTVAAVTSYWQGQIFSGAGLPPREVDTDREVMDWVKENPGGIGYISQSTSVTVSGVKTITVN
ncbi:substrate-binding domain-containing protein [bacterium]|nr:substrate-binding domain-containing protein [bacterium]